MNTPSNLSQTATHRYGANLYALIMDVHGKPLALAPMQQLQHTVFPPEQIRLVDGEARLLETKETALSRRHVSEATWLVQVESALKRLYDLAFLCEHRLTHIQIVTSRLQARNAKSMCLDRGRMLQTLIHEAIEQLRPAGPLPARAAIPRREWHPYLILYRAYVEGEQNYEIMNWLQISEGTFNRTRRRAVETVTKVLWEMEQHAE